MLTKLSDIARFDMLVMFMEEEDLSRVKEMKNVCGKKGLELSVFDKYLN